MSDTSIEARVAALEARLADLERQRWEGPPRLGPQPVKPDVEAMTRIVEAAREAMAPVCMCCECQGKKCRVGHPGHSCGRSRIELPAPPPVDRSKVCTTSGEPAEKVRAEQTEETGQHKSYIVLCPSTSARSTLTALLVLAAAAPSPRWAGRYRKRTRVTLTFTARRSASAAIATYLLLNSSGRRTGKRSDRKPNPGGSA